MFSFLNAYLQLSFRQFILVFISEADVELSNIYSSVKQPKAISIMSEKNGRDVRKTVKVPQYVSHIHTQSQTWREKEKLICNIVSHQ